MRLKHFSIPNGLFFLTVHCAAGFKPFLDKRSSEIYLNTLSKKVNPVRSSHGALDPVFTTDKDGIHPRVKTRGILPSNGVNDLGVVLFAYVVMPDHVHLLLQQPEQLTLEKLMNYINGASAREINKQRNTVGEKFWQGGFHDVFLREPIDFAIKVNYIHNNPVKAGLVVNPEDYIFSSARFYKTKLGTAVFDTKYFDNYSLAGC